MPATPDQRNAPIRILTVNTHKGFSLFNRRFVLHELRDAIRSASPDLVFLQEVIGADSRHEERISGWPLQSHWEFLAETIWGYSAYGRNAVYTHGHHGNAVLSKFPIIDFQNHDVSVGDVERRGLLHCRFNVPGSHTVAHAICVHLGLREWQRQQQLSALGEFASSQVPLDAALIVAGDFNDWRGRAHAMLGGEAGLEEAFASKHGAAARTFPVYLPLLRLDRVYCRNVTVDRCSVLSHRPWSRLSDHAALCVEARL